MTRIEARRKRIRKKKLQRVGAWTVLILIEILIAAAPTAIVSVLALTQAYNERGYLGIGGEWLLIAAVFCITYKAIHNWICNKIFKEEQGHGLLQSLPGLRL